MPSIYQRILQSGAIAFSGAFAIALGTIVAGTYSPTVKAQTPVTKDSSNLESIAVEDDFDWTFSSEKESRSVKDDIQELETYGITEDDSNLDLELSEEEKKWGNQGDVENTSFEIEVYDY